MSTKSRTPTSQSDWILLSGMSLPCVLGLHDWERRNPQTLVVEVGLALDLDAASSGDLSASVDYAAVLEQVEFIALEGKWRLLESMVAAMARHLLARPAPGEARAQVERVRIKLTKPDIFGGRAVPSVELVRDRRWLGQRPFARSDHRGIAIESLTETTDTWAHHVSFDPGAAWQLPERSTAQLISGVLSLNAHRLAPGERCSAPGILRADLDQRARAVVVGPRGVLREASHV